MPDPHVLIVDDEYMVLLALQHALEMAGLHSIEFACDTGSAFNLIDSQAFDLVFLDVNLGSETSYAIAKMLDERGIPYAFVTGYGASGVAPGFRHKPIATKPVTGEDLRRVLKALGTELV